MANPNKKICPLSFASSNEDTEYCIEEECQWWIGAYEREKGGGKYGEDKLHSTENCAIVILAQKNAEGFIDV